MTINGFYKLTIGDLLPVQAARYPENIFLWTDDVQLSYPETENLTSILAANLLKLGLNPGDRLAVLLPDIPEFVITLFSAAKAGLILVPINVRRHPSEVTSRLMKTGAKAIVTFSNPQAFKGSDHAAMVMDKRSTLKDLKHIILTPPYSLSQQKGEIEKDGDLILWDDLIESFSPSPAITVNLKDPAAIIYTLGSSGDPRGAVLSHGGLVRNAANMARNLACTSKDIFLSTVPFSNTFGLTATILVCAVSGGRLICMPQYKPGKTLELIEREGVTVHHGVPTMFAMELDHPQFKSYEYKSLRTGIMSGAPCPPGLVKRVRSQMGINLVLAYGLTETCPSITMTHLDDGPVTITETVGRPMEDVEIKVITSSGDTLPPGEEGELCVRGYNVMLYYWGDPEATSQVIDQDGWLHTGDLAIIDPDGPVHIVGRVDEVIIRGGYKIHPRTVEMIFCSHPDVKDAAVVGVPDLIFGELSYACVVRIKNSSIQEKELLDFASTHLANFAIPDRILFFETLPRHGSGPVRKDYLRERVRIRGHAWKFGKNIDTDAIIPARRCNTADPNELAQYCMEDADPEFVHKMQRGDLIIAGTNFGCGSSREVAPLSIKASGVSAVIAKSFARIFFRNAINIGLPILECPEAVDGIDENDEVEVEPASGTIRNLSKGDTYYAEPFPSFLQRIIDLGGLLAYVEARISE